MQNSEIYTNMNNVQAFRFGWHWMDGTVKVGNSERAMILVLSTLFSRIRCISLSSHMEPLERTEWLLLMSMASVREWDTNHNWKLNWKRNRYTQRLLKCYSTQRFRCKFFYFRLFSFFFVFFCVRATIEYDCAAIVLYFKCYSCCQA